MESADRSDVEDVRDDPASPHYAAWRSLIGQVVAVISRGWYMPSPLELFDVTDAIVTDDQVFLKVRSWPGDSEEWVGGMRRGSVYAMLRRPEGGFSAVGEKFLLVGSYHLPTTEVIDMLAPKLDADALSKLVEHLTRPRDDIILEKLSPIHRR